MLEKPFPKAEVVNPTVHLPSVFILNLHAQKPKTRGISVMFDKA